MNISIWGTIATGLGPSAKMRASKQECQNFTSPIFIKNYPLYDFSALSFLTIFQHFGTLVLTLWTRLIETWLGNTISTVDTSEDDVRLMLLKKIFNLLIQSLYLVPWRCKLLGKVSIIVVPILILILEWSPTLN